MTTVTLTEYCTVDDTKDRIERIKTIINALENAMLDGTISMGRESYSFDDGQTKIQTNFRSLSDITKAYEHWVKVLNLLSMQCEGGGVFTARDMNYRGW